MIHPINLPEELLAYNPTRPTLIELRKRPKITYTCDGRKMKDGIPTTPKSPNHLWESAFVRGFIHRMAYDAKAEAEETSSVESMIDVIDLHPPSSDLVASATDRPSHSSNDLVEPKFALSMRHPDTVFDEDDDEMPSIFRRSSAQFIKNSPSAIIDPETISPILQPCCSFAELQCKHVCPHSRSTVLKEFLRFDFSNSKNLFETGDSETDEASDSPTVFVPDALGSRIWINKPLNKSYGPNQLQLPSPPVQKSQLCFSVKKFKLVNDLLKIQVIAHKTDSAKLVLETSVHLHVARGQQIHQKLFSNDELFHLQSSENVLNLMIDMNLVDFGEDGMDEDDYLVVTILGHISCC
uniref:Uncharacterized protein n=1 Tax=Panagrolaimus sp. JU765 TaxID=591449 RepID=A0AC34PYF7_9BILA